MDAIQAAFAPRERDSEAMVSFGNRLSNQFSVNEAYRRPKELEWLESLRQYKGLYDPDVKIEPNNSKVYPKITRSKINIVLSRLHEMLFPETDKNWEIEPTPEPKISRDIVTEIAKALVKQDPETGEPILPSVQELQLAIKKFAAETCERMSSVVNDQLIEMDYPEETKKVLRSGLMYGTGIMKGPMIGSRTKRLWESNSAGEYHESEQSEEIPFFNAVRIWDWYPDMSVTEIDKIEGSFESHMMSKHDLRLLMKRNDFYPDVIREYMEATPNGDYVPKAWEVDLQVIEVEAGTGKQGRTSTATSAATSDDNSRSTNRQMGKKYRVLEFWGYVDGYDLQACGLDIPDVSLEYAANVWLLGRSVIKAALFEGALDRYKVFYYEKDETSIFGEGLARVMRHSQISIAAAARMVLDNAACVSGPQVEVNWSLMTPDTDINSFYPRKIWYREGKGVDAQYPAIRSLQFESHIPELISIIDQFEEFGDQETTLPTWMIGQMVNNETAQATSGRMATITISIKDVVKNFDTFTEKIMRDLYAWNMEFNPRPDIKGDFNVRARGVSSLVMKEIRMQALNQLMTTMAPEDWVYVDRRDFLKERFKAHDIVIRLKTEEEADEIRQQQENSKMQLLTYASIEAEIAYKKSQTMAQLTKAKQKNVEAIKDAQTPPEMPSAGEDPRMRDAELAEKSMDMQFKAQKQELERQSHELDMLKKNMEMIMMQEKHQIELGAKAKEVELKEKEHEHGEELKEKESTHNMKVKEKVATIKAKQKPAKPAKK